MTGEICENTKLRDEQSVITLIDIRDENTYTVAKLKDNHCWMTQNLRIVDKTIYQSDSDIGTSSFRIAASNSANFKTNNSNVTNNAAWYSGNINYGTLYTWFTATGGSGNASLVNAEAIATNSICPRGWRLPTGGPSGELLNLMNVYGITNENASNLTKSPLNFVYSGSVETGTGQPDFQGSVGRYWSSSAYNNEQAHSFRIDDSSVNANGNHFRIFGHAIRCLVR